LADKVASGAAISVTETTEIAKKWLEITDVYGLGTIDAVEFDDFNQELH
jgi:hypothetical protein